MGLTAWSGRIPSEHIISRFKLADDHSGFVGKNQRRKFISTIYVEIGPKKYPLINVCATNVGRSLAEFSRTRIRVTELEVRNAAGGLDRNVVRRQTWF